jgi:acetyl-CoA carboxylase biotin carboxyl carrier protein
MDLNNIKKLIKLVETADIAELAIEDNGVKIEIKKESQQAALTLPHAYVGAVAAPPVQHHVHPLTAQAAEKISSDKKAEDVDAGLVPVKSPMVGTFYRAPSPDAQPFAEVGQEIAKGSPVCIIEAMKMFNEIESDVSGKIEKILVQNASPVEFGQVLMLVRPK